MAVRSQAEQNQIKLWQPLIHNGRELLGVQIRGGAEILHLTFHSVDLSRSNTVGTKERVIGQAIVAFRIIWRQSPLVSEVKVDPRPIDLSAIGFGGKQREESARRGSS